MRVRLTVEERIGLAVLLTLLAALVVFGFSVASSQGAEVKGQRSEVGGQKSEVPAVPKAAVSVPRVWYFAATATDVEGLESDFSTELVWTNATRARGVTLAWDASTSPGITNYKVYWGVRAATYTNCVSAGTNLTCSVRLGREPKTNRVVHVSSVNATGMWTAATLQGPWIQVDMTNVTLTNPAPSQFWRVEHPARLFIREEVL